MNAFLIAAALGYVLGSIPFGYLLVRIFRGEDVRSSGSGNIGATNVARKSPTLGIATLWLDAGKGLAAVLIARSLFTTPHLQLLSTTAALFAILGHLFPVWLRFRGGKGVATSLGSFALIAPKSIVCAVAILVVVIAIFRFVSLGSVTAALTFPLVVWILHEYAEPGVLLLLATASVLIIWKHRENIGRLAAGTEPKVRFRPEAGKP